MATGFGFHPEALVEFAETTTYYIGEASPRVAEKFIAAVESAIASLTVDPGRWRVVESPESYRPALDALWKLFGPDRQVFGSNWPVSNRVAPYAALHKIVADYFGGKGAVAAEKFFWRNSRQAYAWVRRGAAIKLGESGK